MIRHIPEVLKEDPDLDLQREQAIVKVRNAIARRWLALKTIGSTLHHDQLEEAVASTKTIINDLITIHGNEIPFVPDPEVLGERQVMVAQDDGTVSIKGAGSTSGKSSSSSTKSVAHEFRFLRTKVGVWTCLRATYMNVEPFYIIIGFCLSVFCFCFSGVSCFQSIYQN